MELVLKMLFVPSIAFAAMVIWGITYKMPTGNPFISFQSRSSNAKSENSTDETVDVVTLDSIEGLWRMISVGRNGNFAPKDVIKKANVTMAVVGNTFTLTDTLELSTVELNNSVVPNQLDQMDAGGDKHLCIVRLRNADLENCQAEVGKPRPVDFERNRKDGVSLTMFERAADADGFESDKQRK